MVGASLTIDLQLDELRGAIRRLSKFSRGGRDDLLRDIGEYLLIAHDERFAAEQAPDGTAWTALSPRYKRRKDRLRPGARKLVYDNYLKGTLRYQVAQGELLFGSNRPYAAIQHFGGTIDRPARSTQAYFRQDKRSGQVGNRFVGKRRSNFAQWVTLPAYKINIPARPWLGVSGANMDTILQRVAAAFSRAARGG